MTDLFTTYFSVGIFGSILILVILLLRPLLCKAPRNILCILWILAAVRLLLPFQLESRFSLQPADVEVVTQVTAPSIQTPEELQQTLTPPMLEDMPTTAPDISEEPSATVPTVAQKPQTTAPVTSTPAVDHRLILSAVWLGVGLSLLLYAGASYCILRFKVREAVKCDDGAWESDAINGAFLLGYFKPTIYLPVGLDPYDREFILAHERSHIKNGDPWWKLIGLLCVCVHWYNPLVWLAYILLCRDIEIACDQRVIRPMELACRKAYSMALLNSQKKSSGFFIYPVAFGEISLKQRIKNVLSYRKPALWITIGALILVAVVAVCFLTNPKPKDPDTDTLSQTQTTEPTITTTEPTTVPHTEPPTTEPPTTEPPTTEPPTTEPPTTEPPTTEPPITEPPTTEPPTTEPPTTEPPVTKPPVTEPIEKPNPTPSNPVSNIIAEGNVDHGPVTWKITTDGVLTLSGRRSVQDNWTTNLWKNYSDKVTKIVIEDGITTLPNYAFSDMTNVKEVYLGYTLYKIGVGAFANCSSLQSVTIPESLLEIPEGAFQNCTSLRDLVFPDDCRVTYIGVSAFQNSGVTSFVTPPSLETIDFYAFEGCKSLQTVILDGAIVMAKKYSFYNCTSLKHIVVGESAGSSYDPFGGCYAIETLEIYSDAALSGFQNRTALKSVIIGGKATEVPYNYFSGCTALSSVTITSPVTLIDVRAFENCRSLTSITLPDTVTEIENRAFRGTGLTELTIPASVTSIGWSVVTNSNVSKITFLGDCPDFRNSVFSEMTLTVYYPGDNPTWTPDKLKDYGGTVTWVPQ